jgi:DNA-binding response OmpR family regulator
MDASRVAVVVEDDSDIRAAVFTVLRESGFTVHLAATGVEGVAAVHQFQPDVVTLDIGLPDIDGFEVARQMRQFSDAYIIMVTARHEELDVLLGLESGADDYLTKPFRPRELRARVSALLRRQRGRGSHTIMRQHFQEPPSHVPARGPVLGAFPFVTALKVKPRVAGPAAPLAAPLDVMLTLPSAGAGVMEHNGLLLNVATRTAVVGGSEVDLTRTEFDLLCALMEGGRVVLAKTELARRLRFREYDTGAFVSEADERTVEVHIGNVRRKLGDLPRLPRWVETVRGIGYRMAPRQDVVHESRLSR